MAPGEGGVKPTGTSLQGLALTRPVLPAIGQGCLEPTHPQQCPPRRSPSEPADAPDQITVRWIRENTGLAERHQGCTVLGAGRPSCDGTEAHRGWSRWALPLGVLGDQRRAKVSITDRPSADRSLPFLHHPSVRAVLPSSLPNHSQTVMWSETCPGEVGGGGNHGRCGDPGRPKASACGPKVHLSPF